MSAAKFLMLTASHEGPRVSLHEDVDSVVCLLCLWARSRCVGEDLMVFKRVRNRWVPFKHWLTAV